MTKSEGLFVQQLPLAATQKVPSSEVPAKSQLFQAPQRVLTAPPEGFHVGSEDRLLDNADDIG